MWFILHVVGLLFRTTNLGIQKMNFTFLQQNFTLYLFHLMGETKSWSTQSKPNEFCFVFSPSKFSWVLRPSTLLPRVAHAERVVFLWKPCFCSIISMGLVVLIARVSPPLGFSWKVKHRSLPQTTQTLLRVTQQHPTVLLPTELLISFIHRISLSWSRLA